MTTANELYLINYSPILLLVILEYTAQAHNVLKFRFVLLTGWYDPERQHAPDLQDTVKFFVYITASTTATKIKENSILTIIDL